MSEHVSHLARSLTDLGHTVSLLTTRFAGDWDDSREPCPVTRLGRALLVPMNRSYATLPVGLRLAGDVRRFMAAHEFDVVHCHGMFWPEISYWALRHSRSVNLVSFLAAGFRINRRGGGTCRVLFRNLLRRVDGFVPISERARDAFAAYVPDLCAPAGGLEWRTIPCGIDLGRFQPGLTPLPWFDSARPTILFLGRLDRRKGIRALLSSMPAVLRELPDARLAVVGGGPEEPAARRLAARLGIERSVSFLGRVPREDLPRCYCSSDVYCAPTLGGETLGIVLLEAMASGTPVVASDIPGYDETVRRDRDGILVPPGEPAALAAALVRLLRPGPGRDDLRRRLVESGLSRARGYAWPEVAGRTVAYYRELLARRASAAAPAPPPAR